MLCACAIHGRIEGPQKTWVQFPRTWFNLDLGELKWFQFMNIIIIIYFIVSTLTGADDQMISTGMGYVFHLVSMLSVFTGVPLIFPMKYERNSPVIVDISIDSFHQKEWVSQKRSISSFFLLTYLIYIYSNVHFSSEIYIFY